MTGLILMLAVAGAMALFREALFLAWISLQTFHVGFVAPLTGDTLGPLFDLAFAYADILIAVAIAVLNRRTRQLLVRLVAFARFAGHLVMRRAGGARRAPAAPRRRPPDRDEPEPAAWGGVFSFA
jgi:hypothetical protein